jgi:hypothetical protein
MLRDNLAGLIEPIRQRASLTLSRCSQNRQSHRTIDPQDELKTPDPKGRNLTLTENAASPFHAEPRQASTILGDFNGP